MPVWRELLSSGINPELPTNGLGNQVAVLTGCENFGLYYIRQQVPTKTI